MITLSAAILKASKTSSNPSRIPPLPNTFVSPGTACINILLMNIRNSVINPSSITFEDVVVPWYTDLLLQGRSAADTTGIKNKIFQAFGVASPTHTT